MVHDITIIINTYNEEKNIEDCILSAKLMTDNVLVVDMGSTDKTVELAVKHNVVVKTIPFSRYVEPGRNAAIEFASSDWVFLLDADERLTEELAQEIKTKITDQLITYYKVGRKNIFAKKKWLKYGGFGSQNDQQVRFIKKSSFVDWPNPIHSTPIIKGEQGKLDNLLIHYFHNNLELMVDKTIIFEDIESDLLFKASKKSSTLVFFRKFFGELFRRLIKYQGWRDGVFGVIESIYQAYSKTITYLYLYEKQNH